MELTRVAVGLLRETQIWSLHYNFALVSPCFCFTANFLGKLKVGRCTATLLWWYLAFVLLLMFWGSSNLVQALQPCFGVTLFLFYCTFTEETKLIRPINLALMIPVFIDCNFLGKLKFDPSITILFGWYLNFFTANFLGNSKLVVALQLCFGGTLFSFYCKFFGKPKFYPSNTIVLWW